MIEQTTGDGSAQMLDNFAREIIQNRDSSEVERVYVGNPPEDKSEEDIRQYVTVVLDQDGETAIIVEDGYHDRFVDVIHISDIETAAQQCLENRLKSLKQTEEATWIEHDGADWETVFDLDNIAERWEVTLTSRSRN